MSPAEPGPFESATFDHVALSVGDLDTMIDFYRAAFGFTEEARTSFPALGIRTALLALPSGVRLELAESPRSTPRRSAAGPAEAVASRGYYHWAIQVVDLPTACEHAVTAGGALAVQPSTAARQGMRYAYIADPDGNLIELVSFSTE